MKHEFPIAKRREDGTPAIWLTHEHWMILESGIVRSYLDDRKSQGQEHARRDMRRELGPQYQNKRLREWDMLDGMPFTASDIECAMRLFKVGYAAHGHIAARNRSNHWTPENLLAAGDRAQERGYSEELELIHAAQPKEEAKV